ANLNGNSRSVVSFFMEACEQKIDIDAFSRRHIGPNVAETAEMLHAVGFDSLDALINATVPKNIRLDRELNLPEAKSEADALAELRAISKKNRAAKNFIGAGYSDCITPPVIQRNILENPGWVHALHAVSSRARAGPARSAAQFSDNDCRSNQARHR